MHINALSIIMKLYIERNNIQVELIRFRKKNRDFIDVRNFAVGIYTLATDVFTKLGSLLSVTSRYCSVQGAPDVSGHDHFGTRHFGTCSIRFIVTSGHAQFGTLSLRDMSYRDKYDSGLHNCTISSYSTVSSHRKSVQALIRL